MIVCAGNNEQLKGAIPIGIGLIEVAINLTKLCLKKKPQEIIFIGSAGSYGKYKIFDIVKSYSASNVEISYLQNLSYTPIKKLKVFQNVSCETNVIVNSSNFITIDKNISQKYIENGIDLENMEFYSILKVAEKFKIKAKGIFVITNYCQANAHEEFISNHQKAKQIMEKIIEKL